ncbi:hypothetical protein, partial [Acinetobacter baumannii]|uniref:hypothetical protein n=1 Tax=Acinetobacter baumannii TaxID=470 RepID=UPI000B1D316A
VFHVKGETLALELVPQRLRGEIATFDIKDDSGKVIVEQGRRITARHINQLDKSGIKELEMPMDYVLGRTVAKAIVHPATGEIIAECNTELTVDVMAKIVKAQSSTSKAKPWRWNWYRSVCAARSLLSTSRMTAA